MSADVGEQALRQFSGDAILVLWNARSIASETGSRTLGDEHLLLAVTRTTPSAVTQFATNGSWALADMQLDLYDALHDGPPLAGVCAKKSAGRRPPVLDGPMPTTWRSFGVIP